MNSPQDKGARIGRPRSDKPTRKALYLRERYLTDPEHRAKRRDSVKNWRSRNPLAATELYRRGHLARKFGVTPDWYAATLAAQGGGCAICGGSDTGTHRRKPKSFAVDHCHRTGRVRGLLCEGCNMGIGKLRENCRLMLSAAKYISRHTNYSVEEDIQ